MLSACLPALSPSSLLRSLRSMSNHSPPPASSASVDLLILGAGWTSTFLIPHLDSHHPDISYASTTRDGRNDSIKWQFDPESRDPAQYEALPKARTVLITFPIRGSGGSENLVRGYEEAKGGNRSRWIQLGSTGIWDGGPTLIAAQKESTAKGAEKSDEGASPPAYATFRWTDRHSPYDKTNARAIAEDELLSMHSDTFVLNLSGLWGGERDPSNWISRIATSKQALEVKGSLHLIHGLDVARAILAVHLSSRDHGTSIMSGTEARDTTDSKSGLKGQRYLLTDLRVIDWWDLASRYPSRSGSKEPGDHLGRGEPTPEPFEWVLELMREHGIRALPRSPVELGRALDSREFWDTFGLMPIKGAYEKGRL
ncbi:hypothetical protein JCM10212_006606 [Sporobolomyces blumeae]